MVVSMLCDSMNILKSRDLMAAYGGDNDLVDDFNDTRQET